MKRFIYYFVGLIFIISCQDQKKDKLKVNPDLRDSILIYLKKFDNNSNKEENLNKSFQFVQRIENDSLQIKYLKTLDYRALNSNSRYYLKINELGRKISIKYTDTISLANFYWNLGDFYLTSNKSDKAYFAYNEAGYFYNKKNDLGNYAQMLYNLALIQARAKDFTGTEVTLIKVVEISKEIRNFDLLFKAYSLLGVSNYNLRNFDVALEYLNNALQALGKVEDPDLYRAATFNNVGNVHEKQKNFDLAIKNYRKTLFTKNLYERDPYLYAMALDNLAYNRLESGETQNVLPDMERALEIRQNIKHLAGISISQIHIAEYYKFIGNTIKALQLAEEANSTAQSNNNNRDILASLQLLADLQPSNSYSYTTSYINLSDSLQIEERKVRNKFERIRFETEEVKQRAEMLEEERTIIFLISSLIIILGSSVFIFYVQRSKNRALELERDQKVADEKIYELLLLQSARKDEGKREERDRIARELHDNILTELYANRMNLMFYKYKTGIKGDKKFGQLTDNLMDVERQIRSLSHELSNTYFDEHKEFGDLIQDLIQKQQLERSHQLTIDDSVNWSLIASVVKMHTYRILQEATMNIQKHAEASFVFIKFSLNESAKEIELIIKDDGKGFKNQKKPGIGLKNIKSRVDEVHGKISIDSKLGTGTKISIFIPLK
ncbi:two component sensor histidine kinase [Psychroflexus torquis ATCC 700755]|uniref:Oxygen sensor histidine kinase NreB n=1 Tax=Psychroflexus torquis (strain ATCC 700755 / CIP 106069 / ACAM 623) TaxID=313595 RepID=K4IC89_PSYTT|nr:tetratricopeptide repeat-containing sensor histidine kinase [Psychroflexus torquis]AFU68024.1 two component sensor histidine kinase [Psychroflexus torquis ATCC 700755]